MEGVTSGVAWRRLMGRGALAAALCVVLAAPATGQEAGPPGVTTFEITAYAGLLTPLARLADQGDTISVEFSTKGFFSASVETWLPGGLGFGAIGGYSKPDLTVQSAATGIGSASVGTADYLLAAGTVMWRPRLGGSAAILRPYLAAGAGVLRITYPDEATFGVEDESRFVTTFGAGAHLEVWDPAFVRLDVRDYISKAELLEESKVQHDVTVSVGIGARLN